MENAIEMHRALTTKDIENLRSGQKKLTNMFREFDRICRKYDIKYWCVGGTLIGAIRHKGWIPWDGDIDVHMSDSDWGKFLLHQNELPTTMAVFDGIVGKIKDLYSHYIPTGYSVAKPLSEHNGLQIDVFKYKYGYIDDIRAIIPYTTVWRGDYKYKDTGCFEYDMIFPLQELYFEDIKVYVPGKYERFCKICYDAFPPEMPPVDKRFPQEGRVEPFNPDPRALELYKELYDQRTKEWFRRSAVNTNNTPLHHSSGWSYLSDAKWQEFMDTILRDVDLHTIESVFEGGCGVGAVFESFLKRNPRLRCSGVDICGEAVDRCRQNIPGADVVQSSITKLSNSSDSYDFVLSNCAFSYLSNLDEVNQAVYEHIRIAKRGAHIHLCVFTEDPKSLKSFRLLVPKTHWNRFSEVADIIVEDIPMLEFQGRYNVYMIKK